MKSLRSLARRYLHGSARTWVKARLADWKVRKRRGRGPMPLPAFMTTLVNRLALRPGDSLFVHASFAELQLNCTAEDLVDALIAFVGPDATLAMPFYPIKGSYEWLQSGLAFDLRKHRTSMGALAVALARKDGARKSLHPTKAVVVLGKDRDFLIADHHRSPMPYGPLSPYARFAALPRAKICGLGVGAERLACMHVAVDADEAYPIQPYYPAPLKGAVIGHDGQETVVETYAHNLDICNQENVPKFLADTRCPTYRAIKPEGRVLFSVEAGPLIAHVTAMGRRGKTFFYPASLNFQQPKRQAAEG